MQEPPRSYVLCGTPRTGSTLLCGLLSSTGVLGRPESYFREPDEVAWAARFGLASEGGRVRDYRAFVDAARSAGTTDNGVFGARVMWGSLGRVMENLGRAPGEPDLPVLEGALGPLAFVHLHREDTAAQAVSWCRAEQTGYWQQGDAVAREPRLDVAQARLLTETIREHNAAWRAWFDAEGVEPHAVTYEQLADDSPRVVRGIAARLAVDLPGDWRPRSPHRKQADGLNRAWADALRASMGRRVTGPSPGTLCAFTGRGAAVPGCPYRHDGEIVLAFAGPSAEAGRRHHAPNLADEPAAIPVPFRGRIEGDNVTGRVLAAGPGAV